MPHRAVVAKELAELLAALSHPGRVRIVEELRDGERDVTALQSALQISHSGVSQHLAVLRLHRLVTERREGRHVFYRLRQPELATWLADAMQFLEGETAAAENLRRAIKKTRAAWAGGQ
jgi:DNA-binding transcriptional ArsR family regulator